MECIQLVSKFHPGTQFGDPETELAAGLEAKLDESWMHPGFQLDAALDDSWMNPGFSFPIVTWYAARAHVATCWTVTQGPEGVWLCQVESC
jgi:hypothetical protein